MREANDDTLTAMSTVADTAVDVPASVGAHIFQIEAHHSKEMRELQAKHHQARMLLDKQSAKLEGYAKELHRLRATVTSQNKEVAASRRLVEAAVLEKRQLEAQAQSNRAYAKKIEVKLAMGAKGKFMAMDNRPGRGAYYNNFR